eukprot:1796050-Pyramimonas_sp.AAC.1
MKSSWMRFLVKVLRASAHACTSAPASRPRLRWISDRRMESDCVATNTMLPYSPSISSWPSHTAHRRPAPPTRQYR